MDYYVKSIMPIINANYANLTGVEKNIADYFMETPDLENLSAKAVSKRLFVSEASLSRFAKKCGYRGYREFIYQYEKTYSRKNKAMKEDSRMVLNEYQELLDKMYSLIEEEQLTRIAAQLNSARKVYVCGKGSSGIAASEMEFRFMRTGMDICSMQDEERIRMKSAFIMPEDVLIGISLSGNKEDILYALKTAKKQHAKTILITAQRPDKFREYCDEVVQVPSMQYLEYGNLISPQFPVLMMFDVIYANYIEMDRGEKENSYRGTLKALNG